MHLSLLRLTTTAAMASESLYNSISILLLVQAFISEVERVSSLGNSHMPRYPSFQPKLIFDNSSHGTFLSGFGFEKDVWHVHNIEPGAGSSASLAVQRSNLEILGIGRADWFPRRRIFGSLSQFHVSQTHCRVPEWIYSINFLEILGPKYD